jgi:hypothetical protein
MAFTNDRNDTHPICTEKEPNVYVAGRCSGMGVALSPQLGDRIEQMIYNKPKL